MQGFDSSLGAHVADDTRISPESDEPDWTQGPARWIAVVILGSASLLGMGWSILHWQGASVVNRHVQRASNMPASPPPAQPPSNTEEKHAAGTSMSTTGRSDALPRVVDSTIININTATQAQLELLPGIGPSLATRIIEYRTEHGLFASVDELDRVKGIGSRTLERIRTLVKVGE